MDPEDGKLFPLEERKGKKQSFKQSRGTYIFSASTQAVHSVRLPYIDHCCSPAHPEPPVAGAQALVSS